MLMAGDVDMGHARALLPLQPAQQILAANEIVAKKLSVREAEKLAAKVGQPAKPEGAKRQLAEKSRDILRLEEQLADLLTAEVEIRVQRKTLRGEQGELAVRFGSLDELNGLLDRLGLTER